MAAALLCQAVQSRGTPKSALNDRIYGAGAFISEQQGRGGLVEAQRASPTPCGGAGALGHVSPSTTMSR